MLRDWVKGRVACGDEGEGQWEEVGFSGEDKVVHVKLEIFWLGEQQIPDVCREGGGKG
jgi:hypothetical protein